MSIYVQVWEDDSTIHVVPDDEPSIDAAVSHCLDTGRDSLLHLTTMAGERYVTRASLIKSWRVSTPEGRARAAENEAHLLHESRSNRSAAGLPWGEVT